MKLQITFAELDEQRRKLGARLPDWVNGSQPLDARAKLLRELSAGVEIDLSDVDVGPGDLLTYKGEQIVLYIKDTRSSRWVLENQPEKSRRFHIAECGTLEAMRQAGRFERFVGYNKMNGMFKVDWFDEETGEKGETEAALKVCKNCLKTLDYRGYASQSGALLLPTKHRQSKAENWATFSMSEFFMDYSTFFTSKPSRTDETAQIDRYVQEWAKISEIRREQANWTCEACNVNLQTAPNLLHVHHRNGVKTDNGRRNLQVLCGQCHSEQPMHQHMKISMDTKRILTRLRATQGK